MTLLMIGQSQIATKLISMKDINDIIDDIWCIIEQLCIKPSAYLL